MDPSIESAAAGVWNQLVLLAHQICDHIENKRPDRIVVLHKSAAPVWHAVETLWRATRSAPLPPVAAANIGREKAIYHDAP